MARKTLVVFLLMAGWILAGCDRTPPAEEPAPPVPPASGAEPAAEPAPAAPKLKGRMGLSYQADPEQAVVRKYLAQFYAWELEELHKRFSPEFRESLTLPMLTALRENVRNELGDEQEVLGEQSQAKGEYRGFVRWARFEKAEEVIEILWILRDDDSVAGLFIRPAGQQDS